ncbi:DUF927 domain-containing protein [Allochromatium palmeri]|uniref:DUF927 domain-containing protein n=1 Tax=Allochromatium palmeri TaxID=231048 RepID=A0A6N8EEG7_9GAMM|nr:DUF927 domain-containing protein [Allochromatium palmeri]MTW22625.1 DUF927 domain-containing protein [Allochromatium palmeri]
MSKIDCIFPPHFRADDNDEDSQAISNESPVELLKTDESEQVDSDILEFMHGEFWTKHLSNVSHTDTENKSGVNPFEMSFVDNDDDDIFRDIYNIFQNSRHDLENKSNDSSLMVVNEQDLDEPAETVVPRPGFSVHFDKNLYGPEGVYYHDSQTRGKQQVDTDQFVCSPIDVLAITHDEREKSDFGLLLSIKNRVGKKHELSIPMHFLYSGDNLIKELLNLGVKISPKARQLLIDYLDSRNPERRVLAATTTGWHCDNMVFVLPNKIIGDRDVRFQSESLHVEEFRQTGTFEQWRDEIAKYCSGNPMLILSISATLASPMLKLVNMNQGGLHFFGDSSIGKTTALLMASSCWSDAKFMRTWRATANGIEGAAALVNDNTLILDEISEADPRDVGEIVYSVGNGVGKIRSNRYGNSRPVKNWRVMLLSSGERTLSTTMAEGGKHVKTGQEVRLIDIPCQREYGLFDTLHGFQSGRELADALKANATLHHGHAGPQFLEKLIADDRDYAKELEQIAARSDFKSEISVEGRAAKIFALIALAGELAIEWNIVPWISGEALDAAALAFKLWRENRGEGKTETQQILERILDFISKYADSCFSELDNPNNSTYVRERAGWWRKNTNSDQRVYLFTSAGLQKAASGFDVSRISQALKESDWLVEHDLDKRSKKIRVEGQPTNLYAVLPRDFD